MNGRAAIRKLIGVLATVAGLVAAGSAMSGTTVRGGAVPPSAVLDNPPVVTGVPQEGQTLTTTNGGWTGTTPMTYTYQWQRCQIENGVANPSYETDLSGWRDDAYPYGSPSGIGIIRVTDQAHAGSTSLKITTTGTRISEGVRAPVTSVTPGLEYRFVAFVYSAVSGPVLEIVAAFGGPTSSIYGDVANRITRTLNAGWNRISARLVAPSSATWAAVWVETASKKQAITFYVDDVWVNGCSTIAGATSSSYTVTAGDAGYRLASVVDAHNSVGSASFGGTQTDQAVDKWSVAPAYTGPVFTDNDAAVASDPPPPPPVITRLPTWRNLYDWPNGHGYVGWHYATSAPDARYGNASNLGNNHGLWLWPVGGQRYTPNYAEWTYTAPGLTRISTVNVSFAYRNKLLAHHCIEIGLRLLDGTIVQQDRWCKPALPPDSQRNVQVALADPKSNPTAKVLFFRVALPPCNGGDPCEKYIPTLDPLTNGAYARLKFADMILVDDDVPVVIPSGPLYKLAGDYTNGNTSVDLTLFAHDFGSGVVRGWTDSSRLAPIATRDNLCDATHHTEVLDNRICAETLEYTTAVDLRQFPEGAIAFGERASDLAGTVGTSGDWTVYIDRTPPSPPSNIAEQASDSTSVLVGWTDGVDPPLADGSPGSGVTAYDFRYQLNGGAWSDWDTSDGGAVIAATAGQQLTLEARAIDDVGNYSASATGTFTVTDVGGSLTPDDDATPDPDQERTLTATQAAQAAQLAQTDAAIGQLVGWRALSASEITPWTMSGGSVVGAHLLLSWSDPLTLTTDWPSVRFADSGGGYSVVRFGYSARNVSQLDVMVDLTQGKVVGYEPAGDAITADATTADGDPASATDSYMPDRIQEPPSAMRIAGASAASGRRTTTGAPVWTLVHRPARPMVAAATPICNREGGRNVWRISRKNVPSLNVDIWWNWDFNKKCQIQPPITHAKATHAVDMPVTLVFYGDADTPTAKDIWNRGVGRPILLGDVMYGRVWDRRDADTPSGHVAPRNAVYDGDKGTYLGRPSVEITITSPIGTVIVCTEHRKWHYRAYAPSLHRGGDDKMFNTRWGYYVIATTHIDYKESLGGDCPGHWSGRSETAELRVAATAPSHTREVRVFTGVSYICRYDPDPWVVRDAVTGETRPNTLQLHNYDMRGLIGDHLYENDGKATMIKVDRLSHPFNDCDPHGG